VRTFLMQLSLFKGLLWARLLLAPMAWL